MSSKKDNETTKLNDKNAETKSLFDGLKQYKKGDNKENKDVTISDVNLGKEMSEKSSLKDNKIDSSDNLINNSDNIYISLLENNNTKDKYIGATHYFRKDQLKDLDSFSKKTKKLKNEFMRELIDLVFAELRKGLNQNQVTSLPSGKFINKDSDTSTCESPFSSLLEVNKSKDEYVRATHYFRKDQLEDLEMFVEKSGKSKNEFVREMIDLVFAQLKKSKN